MIGEIAERRVGVSSLMALRTAATSGVGFRHLVRKNAKVAGVYGSGGRALHKILALQNERKIETYKIFSRSADHRQRFCRGMAGLVDAEFLPMDTPQKVMRGADVVVCATNSNVPVFEGAGIEPRQHIVTVVGSNSALVQGGWLKEGRRENDDETARRADFIVTNWRETVEQERQAGLFGPLERGVINSASQRRCDGSRSVIPPICRRLCECAIDCPPSNFRILWEGIDGRQLSMRGLSAGRHAASDGLIWPRVGYASITFPQWRSVDFPPLRASAFLARQESLRPAILRCAAAASGAG
jgi:hypothetical protein